MKWKFAKQISVLSVHLGLLGFTPSLFASDFNIPFINSTGLGTAFADWATNTDDASVAFSNPAALVEVKHQQLVTAINGIQGTTQFRGRTNIPSDTAIPVQQLIQYGASNSGIKAFFPTTFYSVPINEKLTFAIHQAVPFGLGTTYTKDSTVRYISTRSQVAAMDIGPNLGFRYSDQWSFGFGLDISKLTFTLNNMYGRPLSTPDAEAQNTLSGWGYGWHGGILYQPTSHTKMGLSFNSMLAFNTKGWSKTFMPSGAVFRTNQQRSNARLPARTQFSIQQNVNDRVSIMASAFYTNWRTFEKLTLKRVMTPTGGTTSVSIPFNYHNTFDYAFGATFKTSDKMSFRTGMQFMNTPSNNRNRGVADPIGRGTIVAVGNHYQRTENLSFDLGLAHTFFQEEPVNLTTPLAAAVGTNNSQTNIISAQITWNIS